MHPLEGLLNLDHPNRFASPTLERLPMPSLRSRLFRLYIRRALAKADPLSLVERRVLMDKKSERFKLARSVNQHRVMVGNCAAEWLIPAGELSGSAILYLHGGAYVVGSADSHRGLASRIAVASGVRVLLLDYRLAPEHPFPAALEDAVEAFGWIQEQLAIAAHNIVVMGDSAGGGLAIATTLRLRDSSKPLPVALACLSPWTDLSLSGPSVASLIGRDPFFSNTKRLEECALYYAGTRTVREPEISPLFADLQGLPTIFIQVGSDEILLSDSEEFAQEARRVGVDVQLEIWPGMWHVWQGFCDLMPESRDAIKRIGRNIRTALATSLSNNSRPI